MSLNLNKLTPQQEACIPLYREKWRTISFSTLPLVEQKVSEAVKTAYEVIGEKMTNLGAYYLTK
ncbi:hypothetical protein F7734_16685 [Scytonema sp. UIC 10036]|uniref:hypothetical protein n=1 Tax=Scytonema sp. UIC 10036 TaxID=2304196 RepID=UPI0012DA6128|nr:hypothetical protein [Scytonema sp. UIC 10036]MUG93946.1 hypothetical protein [Scytonema sp. UIC 10036]